MSDSQPLSEEKERYPCFLIKKDYFYMWFLFLIKTMEKFIRELYFLSWISFLLLLRRRFQWYFCESDGYLKTVGRVT